jgi:hypothetical protein
MHASIWQQLYRSVADADVTACLPLLATQERRAIKAAFPQREAFGLPRPALRTANLEQQRLAPEFQQVGGWPLASCTA